ncbi:2-amino-4-hydroxy-6-hydroxymethyldihydropteridine diphosphokinase [Lutimonas saemankumensis]|uniref:2-amino-4-hydroxy-6- hydroxymethyldihydropteridine diphosphokinase n=1 Tax=Lutimonas saemankumensis TaxID=483016 RepID=UPI001CD5553E|nr:2-amino-4-hydroxy-6-hydroxymethyldihydropteridine diphosphokinase [Lutimonas saemankumensis]MCA0933539.1 2-amino-4-hydroxy-6-hydroxymethyldihydropteridine diphosphokinase [Lutimonas saemankumensis]
MKIVRTTYLSLGTNLGDKIQNLQQAVNLINDYIGHVQRISSVYSSPSWGFEGKDFYNICIEISSSLNPEKMIQKVLDIEHQLGRDRNPDGGYKDRIIDIDILLFDDEIIFYNDLKVPHPEMLKRKFVLVPLTEIAPNIIHPIAKKTILICLQQCLDSGHIEKTEIKLKRPISLVEKYNYIAIEGNIGSGKTSLANKIGDDFNAKLVLERFADNPFLPKFYADEERYAFPLEMSFLADRYHQLTDDLAQFDLFKNFIVSDYYIFKSLIFAQITLPKEEYNLYRKMFDIMYKEISKPDVYVFLYQNTDRLIENIKKRGREYEQNIQPEYLDKIHKGYSSFIKSEKALNTLVIDVSELDFVSNDSDYHKVLKQILEYNGNGHQ